MTNKILKTNNIHCVVCGFKFERQLKCNKGKDLRIGVRSYNTVTCSKHCSNLYRGLI